MSIKALNLSIKEPLIVISMAICLYTDVMLCVLFKGHTRLVNFYNIGSKFYLVDLPGYGYVQGVGKEQGTRHFVKVAEKYLKQRAGKE